MDALSDRRPVRPQGAGRAVVSESSPTRVAVILAVLSGRGSRVASKHRFQKLGIIRHLDAACELKWWRPLH
jgi:hypothetical protein